jgi:hypothetical protein
MAPLEHYYGGEIRRWQLQNKRAILNCEVSELLNNAYLEVQTGKIATSCFRAPGLHPLNRNISEDFDFDAATEEHTIPVEEHCYRERNLQHRQPQFVPSVLESQVVLPSRQPHILLPHFTVYRKYFNRLYMD